MKVAKYMLTFNELEANVLEDSPYSPRGALDPARLKLISDDFYFIFLILRIILIIIKNSKTQ